jgi:hypothetical protein
MHIPESAYLSDEFLSPATTVFVAEITCILCAREVGIAVDTRWPPAGTVLIQMEGSTVLRRVELRRLRCPDCGGNTSTDEVTTRLLRRERTIDWRNEERPRRGRPPKWLVEQRKAAAMSERRTA